MTDQPLTLPLGFTEKNISSIGGQGKENSPKTLALIRETLIAKADDLAALMNATGFNAKSLSSMLAGARKNLAQGIAALVNPENKEALKAIITEGIFDAKSLSSMLHAAGKDLATGIAALVENKDALKAIIDEGISMRKASPLC